ncbi:MAG: bi-domain-containing oxidoreductase [Spirochaetales bacterium]|nr:bi-domain-containing oxidoreductase [Spirochaetales bacterium]
MLVDFAKKNIIGKAMAMPDQVKKVLRKMKTEGIMSTLEKVQTKLDQPIPLGYSCAGIVEDVGSKAPGFSVGDRVACAGAGYANHAEYNYVPKNLAVKIPETVSLEDAACATVGSIALQGVRQCDLRLGENVCVMGLGLLGLLAVQMLKASGVRVIGFDPDKGRCDLALELGAAVALSENLEAACDAFSEGHGMDGVLITAATKSNEPVTLAGEISRMKGKVVVTGLVGMDMPRDMYYKKELDFKLSLSYGPGRYDTAYEEGGHDYPYGYVRWTEQRNIKAFLNMVAAGTVTPSRLVTHRFGIESALNAYELILGQNSEPYLGIVLSYGDLAGKIKPEARQIRVKDTVAGTAGIEAGFIGAGNFTKAVLLPALKKQSDTRLNTICTATGMNAGQTAQKEGFACATTDFRVLLDNKKINTVFVTTRHNSHARFVKAALEAGKHVFVEKPLCLNMEELEAIRKAAAASNTCLMVGFNRRFSPHVAFIREYFKGRRTPMVVNYRVNAGIIPPDVWIQDPDVGGGRIVGEVCHFIDFAGFVIGSDPVEVQAMCVDSSNASLVAEDNVSISIKYRDGSMAQICYVAVGTSALPKEYCEVFADESAAVMDNFCTTRCQGKRGKKGIKGSQKKGFAEEISAFLETVKTGGAPPIPFESMALTTACTFAVQESLRTRSGVRLG